MVDARLKQLERAQNHERTDIIIKSVAVQSFLSVRKTCSNHAEAMPLLIELELVAKPRFGKDAGHIVTVLHNESFNPACLDVEIGLSLTKTINNDLVLPSGTVLHALELPAIETAACSVRVGDNAYACLKYGDLGAWLSENDYQMVTPHREVMLIPPLPQQKEQPVVEVQLPLFKL